VQYRIVSSSPITGVVFLLVVIVALIVFAQFNNRRK